VSLALLLNYQIAGEKINYRNKNTHLQTKTWTKKADLSNRRDEPMKL
jgi:hypothetical protein